MNPLAHKTQNVFKTSHQYERADSLFKLLKEPQAGDRELLRRAIAFCDDAHENGVSRKGGESYAEHTYRTARSLAEWGQTGEVVAAGILHNVINAGSATEQELRTAFGKDITGLVKGVHELGQLKYRGLEQHLEALRKIFVATAKDVRIILICFANRLDNMRTLEHIPLEKQQRIAKETLEVHARIAHRLGMGQVKADFERTAFSYVDPENYKKAQAIIEERTKSSKKSLDRHYKGLRRVLAKEGISVISGDYRVKNPYSLHQKMERYKSQGREVDEVADIIALRLIIPDEDKCYRTLGIINKRWSPVVGGIKDYIATPKPNGYQSLHTTVLAGDGRIMEIQLRTPKMHEEAEYGIASHMSYKESGRENKKKIKKRIAWAKDLVQLHDEEQTPDEFAQALKTDFLENRVFVFTPRGEVVELPVGSTPIDFAYAIHTEIGDHATAAVINGKYSSLDTVLSGRETVKIETAKNAKPNKKWMEIAKTAQARRKIRLATSKKR